MNAPQTRREIAIVDTTVADYQTLIDAAEAQGMEVITISKGMEELAQKLEGHENIDALHLFSHGSQGQVHLAGDVLSSETLNEYSDALAAIKGSLSEDGDILLYGCNVAADQAGIDFIGKLAQATGADVAASDDLTGSEFLGGDWVLEASTAEIEAVSLSGSGFSGVLASQSTQIADPLAATGAQTAISGFREFIDIDYDSDGDRDFIAYDGSAYKLYVNDGNGGFTQTDPNVTFNMVNASDYLVADFDNDGDEDVMAADSSADTSTFYRNDGGTFTTVADPLAAAGAQTAISGFREFIDIDYDSDGDRDFIAYDGSAYKLYVNDGNGGFTQTNPNVTFNMVNASDYLVADFDNDGDEDVMAADSSADTSTYYRQDGTVGGTDNKPPVLSSSTPVDNTTGIDPTSNISLTFDETISSTGTGGIKIYKASDHSLVESIPGNDGRVTGAGSSTITINPTTDLDASTEYYILIEKRAFFDADGMTFMGIDDKTALSFTTGSSNASPTLAGTPTDITVTEDAASNVDLSSVTFDDADNDTLTVTLTASAGTFAAPADGSGVGSGVTETLNTGSASNIITLVGSAADINSYLDAASNIQYTGAENANGDDAATITLAASDGNGGSLSSNPTVNLDITAVNDAPVLDNSGSSTLTAIDEDPATNEGTLVSAVLGTTLTDVDTGDAEGIAVTAVDNTNGTWRYSTDGTNWSDVGTVADSSALLLAADDKLRFVPDADYSGSATVSYRGWDQTSGTAGSKVDASTNGDATAFSTATESASITVNAVNDAPTLSGGPYAFTATDEDTPSTGVLVSTLLAGGAAADVDGDTLGAAISAQTGNGTWQYSTDSTSGNDGNWTDFGTVGSANSLLLSSSTYVRYNPDDENGETASLTLRAWDGPSGTASTNGSASTASTVTNGDATAFSTGTINANLTVNSVNDAPTGTDKTLTAQKNSPLTIQIADAGFNDVDTGDALDQIIISTAPALGTLWVDTDDDGTVNGAESALSTSDTVTATDISAGLLKYRPAADGVGAAYTTIGFTVHDGDTSAGSGNTWTLNVVSAPAIDLNGAATGNNATATYTENDSDTAITLVDAAATITVSAP